MDEENGVDGNKLRQMKGLRGVDEDGEENGMMGLMNMDEGNTMMG